MRHGRSSIIYETCRRFDGLKAIGVSRYAEKRALLLAGQRPHSGFALSTGRIHSDKTLETYKGVALRYVHWARATHEVRTLAALDAQADLLVPRYLSARLIAGDSAATLATIRAALRMFHRPGLPDDQEPRAARLGATPALPRRRREEIVRSRGPVAMDREIALDRYPDILLLCRATGVRRRELAALTAGSVWVGDQGRLMVAVLNGKGGRPRQVPVLPEYADGLRGLVQGRPPGDLLCPHVPVRIDVHSYRRAYAQQLYMDGGRLALPPVAGRLPRGSIDHERALVVAHALGHGRVDVVVRHYLR